MSNSAHADGTVNSPAPPDKNDDTIDRHSNLVDYAGNSSVPESLESRTTVGRSLAIAQAALGNALKSQNNLEVRVEKIRSSLLIAGEQVPALDQAQLSMMQEAYINAATAYQVSSDKAIIWQQRVAELVYSQNAADLVDENDDLDNLLAA